MSKNNRNTSELQDNLNNDFIFRRDELKTIKSLVDNNLKKPEGKVYAKNLIVFLYAHWEGFIKYSSECYLQFISHQNLRYRDLKYGLLAISNLQKISDYVESHVALKITAIKELLSNMDQKAIIPYGYSIATYSKLNTETLQEICLIIGLDADKYSLKKGIIDEKLVRVRNEIAHGELKPINPEDSIDTYNLVFPIMEEFKNDIENSVSTISYNINYAY
ncbi:MAE_28990/MAE_18760 family HEPN-like nuclease [uncultured Mucilaginibacter sp.]|uniref:MAE_28990/MAE_18760 family HEPN-like nuclease n=1 Tax=uncultured Mucilaginibacter sp. TaxID=797541 RepID=UPI002606D344|nr:MAE_28990/MAE_18760 family HEPN-like nuclease [uncultured Mucilaginibacter sp.]